MAGRRIAIFGLPVVAAGGYYFYAAGGDSKVAQKKAERLSLGNHKILELYRLIANYRRCRKRQSVIERPERLLRGSEEARRRMGTGRGLQDRSHRMLACLPAFRFALLFQLTRKPHIGG